jgi:hypothetical protein|uniref:Uncharacterized protein n=1 Tax=Picea glauca TaxID=3330 RepID=A0A117NGB6_PICGL|nr:hypothetical protein ABT39_MTgene1655 [Picea glauca]
MPGLDPRSDTAFDALDPKRRDPTVDPAVEPQEGGPDLRIVNTLEPTPTGWSPPFCQQKDNPHHLPVYAWRPRVNTKIDAGSLS